MIDCVWEEGTKKDWPFHKIHDARAIYDKALTYKLLGIELQAQFDYGNPKLRKWYPIQCYARERHTHLYALTVASNRLNLE